MRATITLGPRSGGRAAAVAVTAVAVAAVLVTAVLVMAAVLSTAGCGKWCHGAADRQQRLNVSDAAAAEPQAQAVQSLTVPLT